MVRIKRALNSSVRYGNCFDETRNLIADIRYGLNAYGLDMDRDFSVVSFQDDMSDGATQGDYVFGKVRFVSNNPKLDYASFEYPYSYKNGYAGKTAQGEKILMRLLHDMRTIAERNGY